MRRLPSLILILLLAAGLGNAALQPQGGGTKQAQKAPALVTDPTCGMQIDPAKAAGKSDYKGKTYYFCSPGCKKTFDANPEAVLNPKKKS